MISLISLAKSAGDLGVSILSHRQSRQTTLLGPRQKAIGHVRVVYDEVILRDHIHAKTVESLRDAYQLADPVFSREVRAELERLHGLAFGLQGIPPSKRTDRQGENSESLKAGLKAVLERMKSEAAVNSWL